MKNPNQMTDEKIIFWLKKTTKSLGKASVNASEERKYDLVDRFHELQEEAKKRNVWEKYCSQTNASIDHDGWDCMA
jgi:hypothetical protein